MIIPVLVLELVAVLDQVVIPVLDPVAAVVEVVIPEAAAAALEEEGPDDDD